VTYVEDRAVYDRLREIAKERDVTVGELIRDAVAEVYGFKRDTIQMRPRAKAESVSDAESAAKPRARKRK
jgi:predicted DNA-binding ribbon-helix-helix protein